MGISKFYILYEFENPSGALKRFMSEQMFNMIFSQLEIRMEELKTQQNCILDKEIYLENHRCLIASACRNLWNFMFKFIHRVWIN